MGDADFYVRFSARGRGHGRGYGDYYDGYGYGYPGYWGGYPGYYGVAPPGPTLVTVRRTGRR